MQEPSLLDWLKAKFGHPLVQRLWRLGLALLTGLWGAFAFRAGDYPIGYLLIALASGLFVWALTVRDDMRPAAQTSGAGMPSLGFGAPRPAGAALDRQTLIRQISRLRLPLAFVLAMVGQAYLTYVSRAYTIGLAFYALGLVGFVASLAMHQLLGAPRSEAASAAEHPVTFRWMFLALAAVASLFAFVSAGGNRFRPEGAVAWIVSVAAWLAATLEQPARLSDWQARLPEWQARAAGWLKAESIEFRLTRALVLFGLVLLVGAYFRFAHLSTIPPEMTSDHVEKLLDVNDLLNGTPYLYFERNTGREPLQFYFAALVIRLFGTGLTHLTLKLTSAVAGFLMLPYVYLLGRELEDELFGLLAMLLAGISFWATVISRVGLRFPLSPLFVAPVLYYLLRGVRSGRRNDFLLAGLFLGAGLYGYSTFRVTPLLVAAAVAWFVLPIGARGARNAFNRSAAGRRQLLVFTLLLFATTFVVFVPLYRYATQPDNLFWYRTMSRVGTTENAIEGSPLTIFLQNNWNALLMFNWHGDEVWVNTVPGVPVLDVVTGASFILGVVFLLLRLVRRRDEVAGLLLLSLPILMLPSTLSIAFPQENPSAVRIAGAIPVVMLIAAYPLWLLLRYIRREWPTVEGRRASLVVGGALLSLAAVLNYHLYFDRYPAQYIGSAENASEIGAAVRGYADSIGSLDRVYMCLHPYWADTRAVGIYAGQVGWEQVLPAKEFTQLQGDPRPLLVVVNPRSEICISSLRQDFPNGTFTVHPSARGPEKDFLLFFVPGTQTVEDSTLVKP